MQETCTPAGTCKILDKSQTKQKVSWGKRTRSGSIHSDGEADVCGQVFLFSRFFSVSSIIYSVLWVCYGTFPYQQTLNASLAWCFTSVFPESDSILKQKPHFSLLSFLAFVPFRSLTPRGCHNITPLRRGGPAPKPSPSLRRTG